LLNDSRRRWRDPFEKSRIKVPAARLASVGALA
jgi:hypothetical protein